MPGKNIEGERTGVVSTGGSYTERINPDGTRGVYRESSDSGGPAMDVFPPEGESSLPTRIHERP